MVLAQLYGLLVLRPGSDPPEITPVVLWGLWVGAATSGLRACKPMLCPSEFSPQLLSFEASKSVGHNHLHLFL